MSLYQASYPLWKYKCYDSSDGKTIKVSNIQNISAYSSSIRNYSIGVFTCAAILVAFAIVNYALIFCAFKCVKNSIKRISRVRLYLSILLIVVSGVLLFLIMADADHGDLDYIVKNQCTNDSVLLHSIEQMNAYFEGISLKSWVTIGFLAVILVIEIVHSIYWRLARIKRKRQKARAGDKYSLNKQLLHD